MKVWGKYLLFYVLCLAVIGYIFLATFDYYKQNALSLRVATQQTGYASILQSNQILADMFFNEVLNRKEVLELVCKITHTNGDEQRVQRGLLHRMLSATYQRCKKNVGGILQFSFPDNRSMLRFPLPTKHGDDLTMWRPSIALANSSLQAVHGFETGRIVHGYRHVYPLIYCGEHVGSVEISTPYYEINGAMQEHESTSQTNFIFLFKKEQLLSKLFNGQSRYYIHDELHHDFVRHKHFSSIITWSSDGEEVSAEMLSVFDRLKKEKQFQGKIPIGVDFCQYVSLGNTIYSVVFHSVKSVNGQNSGYLIGVTREQQIEFIANKLFIYYLITGFIVLVIIIYRGVLQISQQEKRNTQQILQSFFDNRLVGMSKVDSNGNLQQVNQHFSILTGYSRDELLTLNSSDLIHPDDVYSKSHSELLLKAGNNEAYQIRRRFLRKDGSSFWGDVSVTGIFDSCNRLTGLVGMVIDVTERQQAEDALRKYEYIILAINERIAFIDENYIYIAVSSGYLQSYQMTRDEIIGHSVSDHLGIEVFEQVVKEKLDRCLAGEPINYQKWFEFEGGRKYYDVTYQPYVEADGVISGVVVSAYDMTSHQENIRTIANKQQELEDLNNTLETRIAEATKDLTTSNQNLRYLSLQMEKIRENERKEIARKVHDEIGQMLVAVKFDLARLNMETCSTPESIVMKETIDEEIVELMKKVSDIVSELRPAILDDLGLYNAINWRAKEFARRTGVVCKVVPCPFLPPLSKDQEVALFRIVLEALSNILRHAAATQVTIGCSCEGGMFTLYVSDNGRGITDQQLTASNSFGLMGMSERAEQIGAQTEIEALADGGTIVRVHLPQ
ncbi:MAG: PAS domain S-box protein [Deltaproteobacteria bacterium]|nr:PAS domain S-box protein [Deltaproteobacteria bacterium]